MLEVSTDKINSEIPSPVEGILGGILAPEGQEIQVGGPLACVLVGGDLKDGASPSLFAAADSFAIASQDHCSPSSQENRDFLSPSVMRLIQERGLKPSEIDASPHPGEGGRLTKKDVEQYQIEKKAPCPLVPKRSDTERVKMSALRKAIADNMVRSFYEAPHASLVTEVDVTDLMKMIQAQKVSFAQEHGVKLTLTAFVARAMAQAVQTFPLINASLDGDTIVVKKFVNLGVAVSVDQGVMVPVLKNCQSLSLPEIAKMIADLAEKARSCKLVSSEVQEGTITVTNFGMTGTMIGVPIIRYPEVAIVGLGAVTRKVAAREDDSIAIRSVMWVSLTFDHRVLDGMYGCGFLAELKKYLEHPA